MRVRSGAMTAVRSPCASMAANTRSCSSPWGSGRAVAFTSARRATCAAGSATGSAPDQGASETASSLTRSANAAKASSASPSGRTPSRTSQPSSTSPPDSITWQSIHTCGVCVTPYTTRPGPLSGACVPWRVLVNTTGISVGAERRPASRSTSTPENSPWSRSSKSRAPSARARSVKGARGPGSTASRVTEVKSPTTRPMSGCRGRLANTGRLSVKRGLALHRPMTSA